MFYSENIWSVRAVLIRIHRSIRCGDWPCSCDPCNRTWVEMIFSCLITHITDVCLFFMYFAAEAWYPAMESQHKFQRELLWSEQQCSVRKVISYTISGLNFVYTVFVHTWRNIEKRRTLHYSCFCNKDPYNMLQSDTRTCSLNTKIHINGFREKSYNQF